jgi:hypothetical protein
MSFRQVVIAYSLPVMLACGSSGGGGGGGGHIDANKHDDSGSAADCVALSSYSPTFTSTTEGAQEQGSGSGDLAGLYTQSLLWQGALGSAEADGFISVEIFGGGGGSNTPDWPTTLGPDSDVSLVTSTVDAGAFLGVDLNGSGQAQDIYFSTAGTLDVTAASGSAGGTFSGSISDATFTFGSFNNAGTFVPDPSGCASTISSLSFTATIQAASFVNGKLPGGGTTLHTQFRAPHAPAPDVTNTHDSE